MRNFRLQLNPNTSSVRLTFLVNAKTKIPKGVLSPKVIVAHDGNSQARTKPPRGEVINQVPFEGINMTTVPRVLNGLGFHLSRVSLRNKPQFKTLSFHFKMDGEKTPKASPEQERFLESFTGSFWNVQAYRNPDNTIAIACCNGRKMDAPYCIIQIVWGGAPGQAKVLRAA